MCEAMGYENEEAAQAFVTVQLELECGTATGEAQACESAEA